MEFFRLSKINQMEKTPMLLQCYNSEHARVEKRLIFYKCLFTRKSNLRQCRHM